MKVALIILSMLLSSAAFSMEGSLSFNDNMEVKKVVMMDEILINDLIKLYNDYDFEGERMVAGEFEKKASKKTYLDGLRDKLLNSKGPTRF
jgi:hypothetical protein